jgi:hypothetical protein
VGELGGEESIEKPQVRILNVRRRNHDGQGPETDSPRHEDDDEDAEDNRWNDDHDDDHDACNVHELAS